MPHRDPDEIRKDMGSLESLLVRLRAQLDYVDAGSAKARLENDIIEREKSLAKLNKELDSAKKSGEFRKRWGLAFKWLDRNEIQNAIMNQFYGLNDKPDDFVRLVIFLENGPYDTHAACMSVMEEIVLKMAIHKSNCTRSKLVRRDTRFFSMEDVTAVGDKKMNASTALRRADRLGAAPASQQDVEEVWVKRTNVSDPAGINQCFAQGVQDIMAEVVKPDEKDQPDKKGHIVWFMLVDTLSYEKEKNRWNLFRFWSPRQPVAPRPPVVMPQIPNGPACMPLCLGPATLDHVDEWAFNRLKTYAELFIAPCDDVTCVLEKLRNERHNLRDDLTARGFTTNELNLSALCEALFDLAEEKGVFDLPSN